MSSLITPSSGAAADQLAELVTLNAATTANAAADLARGDISGTVYDPVSGTNLTVKRAFAAIATGTTDGALVAGLASHRIRILSLFGLLGATGTTVTINTKPSGAGTAISAPFIMAAAGKLDMGHNPHGIFQATASGSGISVTTSGSGSTIALQVTYVEVPV